MSESRFGLLEICVVREHMDPCPSTLFWQRSPSLQLGVTATADDQPFIITVLSIPHTSHVTFATTVGYIPYDKKIGLHGGRQRACQNQ